MKSLSRSKVIKSTAVNLGQRKEIDFNTFYSQRVIMDRLNEYQEISLEEEQLLAEEQLLEVELSDEEKVQQLLEETHRECQFLLESAKRDAEILLEDAYEDSRKVLESARTEGYQKGLQEGKESGYQEYQELLEEVSSMKKELFQEKRRTVIALEKDIIKLVIDTAKKVIKSEINENSEILFNLIQEGINKCTYTESLIIRVSDTDYDLINGSKNRVYMMTEGIEDIEIKSDASLSSGSVIIETASGRIDASVETQIRVVEKLFSELLQSE